MDLGSKIKSLRLKRGWSQKDLANSIGKHVTTLSKYESNDRQPKPNTLVLLATTLGCEVADFFEVCIDNMSNIPCDNKSIIR